MRPRLFARIRPAVALAAAAAALALAGGAPPARAEYWVGRTSELLSRATRIEIFRVASVAKDGRLTGTVVTSIRGRPAGETVTHAWIGAAAPPPGADVLAICDGSLCPRAIGADRGGFFLLHAREMMDGAQVLPGIVERAALAPLAAGKPAPSLCVRAVVRLLDEDDAPAPAFTATFSAADGEGSVTGGALLDAGPHPRTATLLVGDGLGAGDDDADSTVIGVTGKTGRMSFVGTPLARVAGGCYETIVLPAHPLARSAAAVARRLDGPPADAVLARGTLALGPKPSSRPEPVEILVGADGQLRFRSARFAAETPVLVDGGVPGRTRVGFSITAGSFYPLYVVEIDAAPPIPGTGPAAAIAAALDDGLAHRWPLLREDYVKDTPVRITPAGTISVTGVRER